jgi:hypothetical protein
MAENEQTHGEDAAGFIPNDAPLYLHIKPGLVTAPGLVYNVPRSSVGKAIDVVVREAVLASKSSRKLGDFARAVEAQMTVVSNSQTYSISVNELQRAHATPLALEDFHPEDMGGGVTYWGATVVVTSNVTGGIERIVYDRS